MPPSPVYAPRTTHEALGPAFFDPVQTASFPAHILRWRNQRAAATVGLDTLTETEWLTQFGHLAPLPDSLTRPLALRYHGHQFRHYNPDLGDGRGVLLAQLLDDRGRVLDLGTKGSGTTPYSRGADGRLTLKGAVRELIATTLLEALGVDTSRTFSIVETGEDLTRHDEPSPTRSAVLVRLNHSHIRVGTFQRLATLEQTHDIRRLLEHLAAHYLPELRDAVDLPSAALASIVKRVARVGAQWMCAGFVHGVLNTDNINVTGESFDYGPWRFLPRYDESFTAAYFDYGGLYAYGRQPEQLAWTLSRLAECLLPLTDRSALQTALDDFSPAFATALDTQTAWRLGIPPTPQFARAFWHALGTSGHPFERTWWAWRGGSESRAAHGDLAAEFIGADWDAVRSAAPHGSAESSFWLADGPVTALVEEVESLWTPIAEHDRWDDLHAWVESVEFARLAWAETQASAIHSRMRRT